MSYSIDEAIVLLTAANLAHQKTGIHNHPRDDQRKKDDAKKQQHPFAPVEDDPPNIERNRERDQANAQGDKEHDGSTAACDAHSVRLILPRSQPRTNESHPEDTMGLPVFSAITKFTANKL